MKIDLADPDQKQVPLIIGVTGHRDLRDDEDLQLRQLVRHFFADLQRRFDDLPIVLLTSLAEGADTLVAQEAAVSGCRVINVLPMPQSNYRDDFEGSALQTFDQLLAAHPTMELPVLAASQQEVAEPGPARNRQYERLGVFLAAHSHILLALWDGTYNQAVGGTGQVVEFHQRDASALTDGAQQRSRLDIADDESDLVYHIVCSRQSGGAVGEGLTPLTASWFTRDQEEPRTLELPQRYSTVFQRMAEFNGDLDMITPATVTYPLEPTEVTDPSAQGCATIQRLFCASDALASLFQKRVLWALRTTLGATLLAGLCFIVYADFPDQQDMIWGYFVFVLIAICSFLLARRRDWQRRYLDCRVLAEGLRVQYYWALGGVAMQNPSRYSHDSFFQGRDLQLGWIRNVMRYTGLFSDADIEPTPAQLNAVIDGWVGDLSSGQLGYYERKAKDKLRDHRETQWVSVGAFVLGLGAALALAIGGDALPAIAGNWLVAGMGLLPVIAAARQNYAHRLAERELAAQYAHMHNVFHNAYLLLEGAQDAGEKQDILRDLGEAALNENAQWVLRQRERPLPGGESVG